MKKSRVKYGLLGICLTLIWAIIVVIYLCCTNSSPFNMKPNEFGDFWAGAVGPVALLWIVLGFWQQGQELRNSVDALNLQSKELRSSVKQQKELVATTKKQLDQEYRLNEEERQRTLKEHRAGMLVALSEISNYAESCIDYINELYGLWSDVNFNRPYTPSPLPDYPQSAFDKLQEVIRFSEAEIADDLSELIALSQIHRSRISEVLENMNRTGRRNFILSDASFHGHFFDALGILKYADRFFEYGRLQRENIEDFCDSDAAAITLRRLTSHASQDLTDLVIRRWPPTI